MSPDKSCGGINPPPTKNQTKLVRFTAEKGFTHSKQRRAFSFSIIRGIASSAVPACLKTPRCRHSRESGNPEVLIITALTIFVILNMCRFFLFLDRLVQRIRITASGTLETIKCYILQKNRLSGGEYGGNALEERLGGG